MALQPRIQLAERSEFLHRKIPTAAQYGIPYRADVPVGQKEQVFIRAIHVELIRIQLHLFEVEQRQQVGATQTSTGVTRCCTVHHAHNVATHLRCHLNEDLIFHGYLTV